ncbi:MAG: hypothetical protein ACK550_02005 [Synechococcaceae cyanobacterium]
MTLPTMTSTGVNPPIASLLVQLEQLSRNRPDRVLRLRGELPGSAGVAQDPAAAGSSATHASKSATRSASDAESESKSEFDAETAAKSGPETGDTSTTDTASDMDMNMDTDMDMDMDRGTGRQTAAMEPFELLIFRGLCCSVTHPTAFDPDRPLLPEGSQIMAAELLAGP